MDEPDVTAELEALLVDYQDVVRRGDRAGFERMYHPTATVSYPDGGSLVTVPAAAFGAEVADLVESGVVVDERARRVDVTRAGNVAVLRVDFQLRIGEDEFEGTDLYTLARLDKRWVITQKLYDMAQV